MVFFKILLQTDKNLLIKVEEVNGWLVWCGKPHWQNRGFSYIKTVVNPTYPLSVLRDQKERLIRNKMLQKLWKNTMLPGWIVAITANICKRIAKVEIFQKSKPYFPICLEPSLISAQYLLQQLNLMLQLEEIRNILGKIQE